MALRNSSFSPLRPWFWNVVTLTHFLSWCVSDFPPKRGRGKSCFSPFSFFLSLWRRGWFLGLGGLLSCVSRSTVWKKLGEAFKSVERVGFNKHLKKPFSLFPTLGEYGVSYFYLILKKTTCLAFGQSFVNFQTMKKTQKASQCFQEWFFLFSMIAKKP